MDAPEPTLSSEAGFPAPGPLARRHEVLGIAAGVSTLLLGLALASYVGPEGPNWIGAFGRWMADVMVGAFGLAAWVLPVELGLATARLFRGRPSRLGRATAASVLAVGFVGCALLQLVAPDVRVYGEHLPGGALGEALGEVSRSVFGTVGAVLVSSALLLVTLALRSPVPLSELVRRATSLLLLGWGAIAGAARSVHGAWEKARAIEAEAEEGDESVDDEGSDAEADADGPRIVAPKGSSVVETKKARKRGTTAAGTLAAASAEDTFEDYDDVRDEELEALPEDDADAQADAVAEEDEVAPRKAKSKSKKGELPRIVAPTPGAKADARPKAPPAPESTGPFLLPPTNLLQKASAEDLKIDPKVLRENAVLLVEKLGAYGVKGRVDEIHPGPVVTMYEFEPESGTKVSKIAGLADDLAMALAAQKVRIVAPIPGKARVGFELPNDIRKTVFLREILEEPKWASMDGALPMALGQDIAGQPVYTDLATMPHVLVAGATGSGK
ncbi:MAG: DNA translocase FtsK, partial [Myxococcales bacterium]|nr:DNA translocase FtsK [Myxococcales bacterium]